ncbi:MAG TPA: pitrilysin family protein [Pyrinomonadaceae bacterium]|nr:pitrilysin family protein [Pyrinomonadaceae bacterium]
MKESIITTKAQRHRGFLMAFPGSAISLLSLCLWVFVVQTFSQETIPAPGAPRSAAIPAVKEIKLKNGLTVAVAEKHNVPLVTVQLLVRNGAGAENNKLPGLANLTASLLTKGTKTRSATQIAEEIEFLGGSIFSFAGWQNSSVGMSITSDKFDRAMEIMADVTLNPSFTEDELKLARSQTLDEMTYSLTQPSFLASYVASRYSFGEHPAGGTPASIAAISRADIASFYSDNYRPAESVLIFVGDITPEKAAAAAEKYFGAWKKEGRGYGSGSAGVVGATDPKPVVRRMLIVDLPNAGQAAVNFVKPIRGVGRRSKQYYAASVLNSLLGGGYSSRLNLEIRIKRGLSYGAGSNFGWRDGAANFSARTQTKNESAAQVAELIIAEIKRLAETSASEAELSPRKSVLTGGFGRNLETTQGLAGAIADLYTFRIPTSELNAYMSNVNSVQSVDLKEFASMSLFQGDIIIVGDYSVFKDDLAKRFPGQQIAVIKASELDIDSETLRKGDVR